jgi:hypothetical protein
VDGVVELKAVEVVGSPRGARADETARAWDVDRRAPMATFTG